MTVADVLREVAAELGHAHAAARLRTAAHDVEEGAREIRTSLPVLGDLLEDWDGRDDLIGALDKTADALAAPS